MKKLYMLFALIIALAMTPAAFAQTATYQTALNGSMTTTQGTVTVLSMTNMVASSQTVTSLLFCDGELMKINAINTTTLVATVSRGYGTTHAGLHPTSMPCWFGVAGGGGPFITQDPTGSGGMTPVKGSACTRTDWPFLPMVNSQNNSLTDCKDVLGNGTGTRWQTMDLGMFTSRHPVVSVNDAAYTVTMNDEYVIYDNITSARTATLYPVTGIVGARFVLKNNGTTSAPSVTIAAPSGQFILTPGTASTTVVWGGAASFISIQSSNGAWGWTTAP